MQYVLALRQHLGSRALVVMFSSTVPYRTAMGYVRRGLTRTSAALITWLLLRVGAVLWTAGHSSTMGPALGGGRDLHERTASEYS